jgi:hypothetical protein
VSGDGLGLVCKRIGQLSADALLQVHVLTPKLTTDECNGFCGRRPYRPVVLPGELPQALGHHTGHQGGDELVKVELQLQVLVLQHTACYLREMHGRTGGRRCYQPGTFSCSCTALGSALLASHTIYRGVD